MIKSIATTGLLLCLAFNSSKAQLLTESFDYTAGDNLTSHGWTAYVSGGINPIKVGSIGLTYSGITSAGNSAYLPINGEDVMKDFDATGITSGNVYARFLVNIDTLSTSNETFFSLTSSSNGSDLRARFFAKQTTGQNYQLGISFAGFSSSYASATYAKGTTICVIIKYEIVSGADNDVVSLFAFTSGIPSTEPVSPDATASSTFSDINPGAITLRQVYAANKIYFDEITVSTTWPNLSLPISLVKFSADKIEEKVKLSWTTAMEINNDKFLVEKSIDGKNFEFVSEIKGAGNSKEINNYSIEDNKPYNGNSYYRLSQYDFDGNYKTFTPVLVNKVGELKIQSISNVIEEGSVHLNIYSPSNSKAVVRMIDLNGRILVDEMLILKEGYQQVKVKTNAFMPGIYAIQLISELGEITRKIAL